MGASLCWMDACCMHILGCVGIDYGGMGTTPEWHTFLACPAAVSSHTSLFAALGCVLTLEYQMSGVSYCPTLFVDLKTSGSGGRLSPRTTARREAGRQTRQRVPATTRLPVSVSQLLFNWLPIKRSLFKSSPNPSNSVSNNSTI